ncbi:MAG: protein translocase subunit SecD [Phycisphaerales bacterium]
MKDLTWKIVIILVSLVIAGWAIVPPGERLKLGKDLAGGTTLTYSVVDPETNEPPTSAELEQLIAVIKERIDPRGIYDISVVAQGTNQIEITMPAPTPEVIERRRIFDERLAELSLAQLPEGAVDESVRLEEAEREARFAELTEHMPERAPLLEAAASAYDEMQARLGEYGDRYEAQERETEPLRDAVAEANERRDEAIRVAEEGFDLDEGRLVSLTFIEDPEAREQAIRNRVVVIESARLRDAGETVPENEDDIQNAELEAALRAFVEADDAVKAARAELNQVVSEWVETLAPVEQAAAEARIAYEEARDRVEESSVDPEELRRVLALDTTRTSIRDRRGELVEMPSQREIALERLRSKYPMLQAEIDELVQLYDDYKTIAKGYDDPKDLIALLRGAGVLHFRIGVTPSDQLGAPMETLREELEDRGPRAALSAPGVRWFPLENPERWVDRPDQLQSLFADPASYFSGRDLVAGMHDGVVYLLLYSTLDRSLTEANGDWSVTGASPTVDNFGRSAVGFRLDAQGAQKFGRLTGENIGRPLAIVLDNKAYSAPTLQGRISSQGQITGRFSQKDIEYLLKVLNAGALQSQLSEEPIAQNTLGPSLGADNLQRGLEAGIIALIVVAIFMLVYYFFAGVVANVALLANAILILGAMSLYQAAFTMPGIAGIILTFGMAVDANVLIYERIREELGLGADLKTAVRLGYEKALSTIVDANVTNLIVCFALGLTATAEVKGFAITLGIGIVATLYSALFITRVVFALYVDVLGAESLPMLPSVWRTLGRLLEPNFQWVRFRPLAWSASTVAVLLSIWITYHTWHEMLDTEFLGGTSVTFQLKRDEDGGLLKIPRVEVEERIQAYAEDAYRRGEIPEERYRALLQVAALNYNIDEVEGDDFRGNAFVIKSTIDEPEVMERAVTEAFEGLLDAKPPVEFVGADLDDASFAPVMPVLDDSLGEVIGRSNVTNDVSEFSEGVAIVLEGLDPPLSREQILARADRVRRTPEFQQFIGRRIEVIGLERADGDAVDPSGRPQYRDAVVLVESPELSFLDQRDQWGLEVADIEWSIIRRAMTEPESLDQVTTISPAIAKQFRDKAIVAITLSFLGILAYVWVRFGSFWYSFAAIVALIHDVCVTLGLLSLTHYVYNTAFGQAALIEPFKIDLGVVAALLTIIGYSLNDTIVILDRIRENRGKLAIASAEVVNRSINQTMSRTLLTSGTTMLAVIVMYVLGSSGIRPFTFAMICGVIVGTYSTVGIAAPMVFRKTRREATRVDA